MKSFPWARVMDIGFGHLKLAPDQFWRMTLPELAAATRMTSPMQDGDMKAEHLQGLMRRFPDGI